MSAARVRGLDSFALTGRLSGRDRRPARCGTGSRWRSIAEAGADIVAVSAQLEASGSIIQTEVERLGRQFTGIKADLSSSQDVSELGDSLRHLGRPIDILVNNAGTIIRGPSEKFSDSDWDTVLQVNLTSQFSLTRDVAKGMLERGYGKIIFTASLLSFQGGVNVAAYTASKSGIAGVTKALANEWSGRGINVNAIAPGYIETDNTQALQDDPARRTAITDRIPAGRWGTPDDIAGATVSRVGRIGLRQRSGVASGWRVDGPMTKVRSHRLALIAQLRIVPAIVIDAAARAHELGDMLVYAGVS